ncbi:hypothetical protein DMUE_5030, partial [Dictyocoela muelleri]
MFNRLNRATDHEFGSFIADNENIIDLLQALEIIQKVKFCLRCNKSLAINNNKQYNIGKAWRCCRCKLSYNLLEDTSLSGKKISPFVFMKFAFYFYSRNNFTADYIMQN